MDWSSIAVELLALIGTVITVWAGNSRIQRKLEITQAVTETKIEELTREVRLHNNFARRLPVVEEKVERLEREVEGI